MAATPLVNQAGSVLRHLGRNLRGGIKSAALLRVDPDTFHVSWAQLIALLMLTLAPPFLADFLAIGLQGRFAASGLPGALFLLPLAVIAASLLAYLARQAQQVLLLATAFVSLALWIDVATELYQLALKHTGTPHWPRFGYFSYYAPFVWFAVAAGLAAVRLLSLRLRAWPVAFVLTGLLLALPQATIWHDRTLWATPYEEESAAGNKYQALASEEVFYLQPKLLERQLAALQPGRKGIVDLYFVGVAGYSGQDVFMKEVDSVSKLFKQRFDTQGRTISLVNNAKTASENPLASSTSLRAALTRIGELMDRDEDIVFLFLTSHGSKERGFAFDVWPFRFKELDPRRLRKMLDDSGIKRRVIVVSACYSGIFVEPLKNEHTLIITAAAADKNSFGCSNEADYTYFGKAYFDEALRTTYSFTEAFALASRRIAEREKAAGYDSSDPVIFVGTEIEQALAALEDRLKAGPGAAVAPASAAARKVEGSD
jgi:hypothetical protein